MSSSSSTPSSSASAISFGILGSEERHHLRSFVSDSPISIETTLADELQRLESEEQVTKEVRRRKSSTETRSSRNTPKSRARKIQTKRLYWYVVRSLRQCNVSFLSRIVRDADIPSLKEIETRTVVGTRTGTLAMGSGLLAMVGLLTGWRVAITVAVVSMSLPVLDLFRIFRLRREVDRVAKLLEKSMDEIGAADRELRRAIELVGRAELVARGYRPTGGRLPPIARIERSSSARGTPLQCVPLRRDVRSTALSVLDAIRKARRELRDRFGVDDDLDISTSFPDGLDARSLESAVDTTRRESAAMWYELLAHLARRAQDGTIASRDERLWIAEIGDALGRRVANTVRTARTTLDRRVANPLFSKYSSSSSSSSSKTDDSTTRKATARSEALRHLVGEIRGTLRVATLRALLCQQRLACSPRDDDDARIVANARRDVDTEMTRVRSLWDAAEKLVADDASSSGLTSPPKTIRDPYISSAATAADGAWGEEPVGSDAPLPPSREAGVVDVYVGGKSIEEEEEEENSMMGPEKSSALTAAPALKLSEAVFSDLASALRSPRKERTHRIQEVLSTEDDDDERSSGAAADWEIVPSGSSLLMELSDVLRHREEANATSTD